MSQERELETYLQGKSDLSRAYRALPDIEPPDHLDAAILAEAHRAVGARPGAASRRWFMPLSMAASLFLVVMVGLQVQYRLKDAALLDTQEEAPAPVAANERAPAPAPAAPEAKRADAPALAKAAPPAGSAQPGAAAVAAEPAAQAGVSAGLVAAQPAQQARVSAGLVAAEPAAQARMSAAPAAAEPAAVPVAAESVAEAPAPPPPVADKARAAAKREAGVTLKSYGPAESVGSLQAAAPAPAAMPAPAAADLAPEAQASPQDEAIVAGLPPQDWMARIERLMQRGKREQARKELAAFRKRYPEYPVPRALETQQAP